MCENQKNDPVTSDEEFKCPVCQKQGGVEEFSAVVGGVDFECPCCGHEADMSHFLV